MRTTMNTVYNMIQGNLNRITTDLNDINQQISSGRQMSEISDDPVGMMTALRYRSSIAELDQYEENIMHGGNIIDASELALTEMKELVSRAKVLSIAAIDAGTGDTEHEAMAAEIENIIEQIVMLGNSQINGKYIFGGFRTAGYSEEEPTPFILDKGDGYWINGQPLTPLSQGLTTTIPNLSPPLMDIDPAAAIPTSLEINGEDMGTITLTPPVLVSGINMAGAEAIATAINTNSTAVTASLTTQVATNAVNADTGGDGLDSVFRFDLNEVTINLRVPNGSSATVTADTTVAGINQMSHLTGVIAERGTGFNGGANDSIIFKNAITGDNSSIDITNYVSVQSDADPNLVGLPISQVADATHNTGEITLTSNDAFTITSPNQADDSILNALGLGGGGVGFVDDSDDGILTYGYQMGTGDLQINGLQVPATSDDGISSMYSSYSAAAKANAINSITADTGVTATVVPASTSGSGSVSGGTESARLTGTVTTNGIALGDMSINGTVIEAIPASGGATSGLFMDKAAAAKYAINNQSLDTGVTAHLTTLYSSNIVTTADTNDFLKTTFTFDLNGESISVTTPDGATATEVAALTAGTINASSDITGIQAAVGNGNNGAVAGSLVFTNVLKGDETPITVTNFTLVQGDANPGFGNFNQAADATHNTGEISLESSSPFTVSSPTTTPTDLILNELGLQTTAGFDSIENGSTPSYMDTGDLIINGVDIFSSATAILDEDQSNAMVRAINEQSSTTGVKASRSNIGNLILSTDDGRNLDIQTSVNGENITHLLGSPGQEVSFGKIQLNSSRTFSLDTTVGTGPDQFEAGLASLGMSGGQTYTEEVDDLAGDGHIDVKTVRDQEGSVRYAGDRENDLAIKINKTDTLLVGENGQRSIADTDIFTLLQDLEDTLRNKNYTTVTGINAATNTSTLLNSHSTGLEPDDLAYDEDLFIDGSFTVNVTDNAYYPPRTVSTTIQVTPDNDTLDDVMQRIDGIANVGAEWTSEGYLKIESSDPDRYTYTLSKSNSNFLEVTGISYYYIQEQALEDAVGNMDEVMNNLTSQVSEFGARANRINVQTQLYAELKISTQENLSEVQDTDLIEALMNMKSKEVAYQAALSAASKTMQLSLVDYL